MAERVKKILLVFILLVLLLPLAQKLYPFIESAPLNGSFEIAPNVKLGFHNWMDGSYQEAKSKHINDSVSFRSDLIRLNCQIDYSLFYKLNTGWNLLGKNNCLLDMAYVNAWAGNDFVGYDPLCARLVKLKALQDTFARLGKTLVLVHAASKAFYYADCIPDELKPAEKKPTNFGTCMHIGDSLGLNQLDLNSWFCAMKDTSRELLYPKQGLHWTYYGGMLAADSLAKYIERLRGIKMPHPRWRNIIHTQEPRFPDDDLVAMLNLIWPYYYETFTYGQTMCGHDSTKTRPATIYIGDSFIWALADNDVFDCMNSNWELWFYFKELYRHGGLPRHAQTMEHYDWQGALGKADCIVLLYTASVLDRLGSGFIETAYDYYYPARK